MLFAGVSEHRLGLGPQGFGYLLAGLGVGGVLAAGAVNRLAGSRRLALVILGGSFRSSAAARRSSSTCSRSQRCSDPPPRSSSRACS